MLLQELRGPYAKEVCKKTSKASNASEVIKILMKLPTSGVKFEAAMVALQNHSASACAVFQGARL